MDHTEHPVDPAIRAEILEQLCAIEAEHQIQVLYACESGSRGWGFASPDSDYDVRFLYVHALPWYLRVTPGRDVIERPLTAVLDINGWELRKTLALLKKGNATLIEWLDSPVVYRAEPLFLEALRALARQVHQPERSFHHYIHMARRNHREFLTREQVRLKKYLYVLRPLLATLWIEQGLGSAPMRFATLVEELIVDAQLRAAIDELLRVKRSAQESEYGPPQTIIDAFITRELTRLEAALPPRPQSIDGAGLDRLLMETVLRRGYPQQRRSPTESRPSSVQT